MAISKVQISSRSGLICAGIHLYRPQHHRGGAPRSQYEQRLVNPLNEVATSINAIASAFESQTNLPLLTSYFISLTSFLHQSVLVQRPSRHIMMRRCPASTATTTVKMSVSFASFRFSKIESNEVPQRSANTMFCSAHGRKERNGAREEDLRKFE